MAGKLSEMIKASELCIIGIGDEWNWVKWGIRQDPRYSQILEYCKDEGNQWLLPIVEYEYAYYNEDKRTEEAYKGLKKLIGDKKYFIVSDIFLQDALIFGFDYDRAVYPCGNYGLLQTNDVADGLMNSDKTDEFMEIVDSIHAVITNLDGNFGEDSTFRRPFKDGKELYLNQKRSEYGKIKYNESAYMDGWDKYMKYLTTTVNKKVLLLELGVGLDYPTVIRWPFEKLAFVNEKAHLVRVHERLFHHTPEIAEKTDSIKMNSVDYILQECQGL
jgi:hypothetical protein